MSSKKTKIPFIVVMSFSRFTIAEVAKNYLKDKQLLEKILRFNRVSYKVKDFLFLSFINDANKVFRVLFQVVLKDKARKRKKLLHDLKVIFESSDIEIEKKQDFDFKRFNLKNQDIIKALPHPQTVAVSSEPASSQQVELNSLRDHFQAKTDLFDEVKEEETTSTPEDFETKEVDNNEPVLNKPNSFEEHNKDENLS